MNRKCPTCNSSEGVRKFLYGMPIGEPDGSKYVLGGCDVIEGAPDYKCLTCGLEFHVKRKKKEDFLDLGPRLGD
jgi:DNA-directed RNA polymerase subunit RPC12/RpoP